MLSSLDLRVKKKICGMEGENVVAYGSLPSPALPRHVSNLQFTELTHCKKKHFVHNNIDIDLRNFFKKF